MFITRRTNPFLLSTGEEPGAGQAPENTEGTPDNAAQDAAAQTQAEIDWAKRYSDLQPEYTRATQEAATLRRERELYQQMVTSDDPDTRRQAAQELGYQLDDETDHDTQYQDLDPRLVGRLEALEQRFQQQTQQAEQSEQLAQLEVLAEQELDALKVPKGDEGDAVRDWIVSRAVALPPNDRGLPDIRAAHAEFEQLMLTEKKRWAGTKRTHQFSGSGEAGTQALPRDTHEQRVARAMARLQADQ